MKALGLWLCDFATRLKRRWTLSQPWETSSDMVFLLTVERPGPRWTGIPWRTFRQADFEWNDPNRERVVITFDRVVVTIEGTGIEPLMSGIGAQRVKRVREVTDARWRPFAGPRIHRIEVRPVFLDVA